MKKDYVRERVLVLINEGKLRQILEQGYFRRDEIDYIIRKVESGKHKRKVK